MEFTVVDPSERVARIRGRGAVALVVRGGESEVFLVPPPPERVVLEMGNDGSSSGGGARLRVIRLRSLEVEPDSEGLASMLRRLADALDPESDAESPGTGVEGGRVRLVLGAGDPADSGDGPGAGTVPKLPNRADLELLSHELRTPINALVGYAALLDEAIFGDLNQRQANAVKHIRESGERLLSALTHLFQMTRVDLGEFEESLPRVRAGMRSDDGDGEDEDET